MEHNNVQCYGNRLFWQVSLFFVHHLYFFCSSKKYHSFGWSLVFLCILEALQSPGVLCGGVNANMSQSVCHIEKTIHANLLPQTGVQLGQSGGESSGVERAQRSLDQGLDCSRVIYSRRTMMAAWVSTDGGALTAPAQTVQTQLTFMCWCAYMHEHTCRRVYTHTLCVSHKGKGDRPCQVYPVTCACPRGLHLTRCISLTTQKPKQLSKLLPMNSAQIKRETTFALQWRM